MYYGYNQPKPTPLLSPTDRKRIEVKDLKDQIDLALALGDSACNRQLFMELTDKLKEYEVSE